MQASNYCGVRSLKLMRPATLAPIIIATLYGALGTSGAWAANGVFTYVIGRVEVTSVSSSTPVQARAVLLAASSEH